MLQLQNGCSARLFSRPSHPQPRVINTDQARLYGSAIPGVKEEGILRRRCRRRPVQYLNNILEQNHRAIQRRAKAKQNFREFQAARRTIEGYEAIHMIRKEQARWVNGNDVRKKKSVHRPVVRSACLRLGFIPGRFPSPVSKLQHFHFRISAQELFKDVQFADKPDTIPLTRLTIPFTNI
jgi:hypothetical protein